MSINCPLSWIWIPVFALSFSTANTWADETPQTTNPEAKAPAPQSPAASPTQPVESPANEDKSGLVRIHKEYDVWIEPKRKLVVVDGEICLREGQLEMFACPKGTKEHESVISVNCPSRFVHTGLLAVGAKPGEPVRFDPVYRPATGPKVEIFILWTDKDGGRHKVRAQEWIRHVKTDKAMPYDFVFAGSGFVVDQHTGKKFYMADGGEMICVSNFGTAMIDLPVESSQTNADLLFDAFTENIPPIGTKVRMVLIPETEEETDTPKPAEAPKAADGP